MLRAAGQAQGLARQFVILQGQIFPKLCAWGSERLRASKNLSQHNPSFGKQATHVPAQFLALVFPSVIRFRLELHPSGTSVFSSWAFWEIRGHVPDPQSLQEKVQTGTIWNRFRWLLFDGHRTP